MPGTHAILSASAAYRWLNCPPSAILMANMPESTSEYAAEGTLAHSLAELKVTKKFTTMKKSEYDKRMKEITADPLYQPEMDTHTTTYLDYILSIAHGYNKTKPYVVVEKKLDFSHIAPDGYGTGDCVMLCKNDLHIFDFKYGKGVPVSAEDNPQLKLYALGAMNEYGFLYDISNVILHIVQPRLENALLHGAPPQRIYLSGEIKSPPLHSLPTAAEENMPRVTGAGSAGQRRPAVKGQRISCPWNPS